MRAVRHETQPRQHVQLHTGKPQASCTDSLPHSSVPAWWSMYKRAGQDAKNLILGDVSAGLVVAVMLIPQGMAYAALVGVPPIHGLYASILALLVYPWFGTSGQLAIGPVAVVSLLSNAAIAQIAEPGSVEFTRLAMVLALLSGVWLLVLGVLRAGFLINFLSHPVLKGFTSAAAIIIGSSQLGKLLGVKLPRSSYVYITIGDALARIGDVHLLTLLLAVGNILLFIAIAKGKAAALARLDERDPANHTKRVLVSSTPAALIVVVVNLALVAIFDLDAHGVAVVGDIPGGFPTAFEVFDGATTSAWWKDVEALAVPALVIAMVGYLESISISKAMSMKYRTPDVPLLSNQELYGIGFANIAAAMFGGVPVTGGFSRTGVNGGAGSRTPFSSIVSGAILLLVVLWLTPLFEPLPDVTLAATIVVAVAKLIDVAEARTLWKVSRPDLLVFVTAFVATLLLGIEEGILVACALSLAVMIKQTTTPHWALLGKLPRSTVWRNVRRFPNAAPAAGIAVVRFDAQLYFANTNVFQNLILDVANDVVARPVASEQQAGVDDAAGADVQPSEAGTQGLDCDHDHDAAASVVSADSALSAVPPPEPFPEGTRHVVVDCGVVSTVDYTAMHMLTQLPADLARAGLGQVRLWLVNIRGPVRDALRRMLAHEHDIEAKAAASGAGAGTPTPTAASHGHQGVVASQSTSDGEVAVVVASEPPAAEATAGASTGAAAAGHHLDVRLFCVDVNDAVEWLQLGPGVQRKPHTATTPHGGKRSDAGPASGAGEGAADDDTAAAASATPHDANVVVADVDGSAGPAVSATPVTQARGGDGEAVAQGDVTVTLGTGARGDA